ncbi:MAG TPA: alpha/beta fold hydrolase [Candidatus Baltobacteraceae bacterium]|nr:alpha/beta fold hydrolase [Candidatus Baltobacteraceae bacterium]
MGIDLIRVHAQHNDVAVLTYEPRRPRNVSIVAGHGYSSSKHNLDLLCYFLSAQGFRVYNLDFPGHKLGASGGELRGIEDCVDAMNAVVARAREDADVSLYTLGHSMGAMTALFVAAADSSIAGAVSIATGYGWSPAVSSLLAAASTDFRSSYVDGVELPVLFADAQAWYARLLPQLAGRPVLYIAAARDAMVSLSTVRELYDRAPEPKSFVTIESDHTYAGEHAKGEVLQWLNHRHPRA